jgi:two-component SAPR family response regulator
VFQLFLDQGDRSRVVSKALVQAGEKSPFLERVLENLPQDRLASIVVPDHAIRVKCFGNFRVLVGGQEISQERWVSAKARDLLSYFVTMRGERIPVDKAFDAIWGDKGGSSRTAFHTALSRLRNALKSGKETPRLILVEVGEYWLDSARFTIDVDEFNSALAQARAGTQPASRAVWYQRAVSLYQGEYLQNLYYEWIFPERRRLTQAYLTALQELASFYLANRMAHEAQDCLERAILLAPLDEELYCQAMRACSLLNDRAGVAQKYQQLKEFLASELDVKPLPSTSALYQTLSAKTGSDNYSP